MLIVHKSFKVIERMVVDRLRMRKAGLRSKVRRKDRLTTDSKHNFPVAPHMLERNFTAQTPEKVWVSDYHVLGHPHGLAVFDGDHRSIFGYLEVFYNRQRRHSTTGYLCPAEYEKQKVKLCA